MFSEDLRNRAAALVSLYKGCRLSLTTAESCTGGLLAALITEIAGSSKVFDRGFVTYSNEAKIECLGVPRPLLESCGAVSAEVARTMVEGALAHSRSDVAVSITGIAGPDGGSPEKPVGLVFLGYGLRNGPIATVERRFGDLGRDNVRKAALTQALELLFAAAETLPGRIHANLPSREGRP